MPMETRASAVSDTTLGPYRIVRAIYPGVSSTVLEAVKDSTGKRFAIKQMLDSKAEDGAERRAFAAEARLGLSLNHPNLIRFHEYVPGPDAPYFVMDFFAGFHLKLAVAKPKEHPALRAHAHKIITEAARGLAFMHERGWIHRDIKPENLMANKVGEVRVIDYTISRRPVTGLASLFKKTMSARQGTASYMAPEQILLATPTIAADIYSFGATCYEIACGRPPFRANSVSELLGKHVREQPSPPTMHCPEITPEFSDLIMQCLRKAPADRPADLREFLTRFARVRVFKDDPAPATTREFR